MRSAFHDWTGPDGASVRYAEVSSFGTVWVAAGGPESVGGPSPRAARAFEGAAQQAGARALWFGVTDPSQIGGDRPALVIGAEPVWDAARWPGIVAQKRSLRAQIARARNKGVTVAEWSRERVEDSSELPNILTDWLDRRGLPPLSFLADPYIFDPLGTRRLWVAERGGVAVGYLAMVPDEEAFIEWIIQSRDAPNGTAALLLDAAVRSLAPGSQFTLGLVPLSTHAPLSETTPPRTVRALLAWVRAHATRFYNFEGLERFKSKFVPDRWRTLWLITDGRPVSLLTFHAVAAAFSGRRGPTRFVARAIVDAAGEETRRLRERFSLRRSGRSPESSD